MDRQAAAFSDAAHRAASWIASQQRPDGSLTSTEEGADRYYKVPYALAATGHLTEANRLLDWTRANAWLPGGELRLTSGGLALYKHSWVLQGAVRLARFDVAMPLGRYIMRCAAPCGGFFQVPEGSDVVEPACLGWGGMAMVYVGQLELARKAGDAIGSLIEQQPDPTRFYATLTPAGELIVGDGAPQIDFTQPEQVYWYMGIPFLFLTRLYLATSDDRYLGMAQRMFQLQSTGAEDAFNHATSGKSGLAAAILYSVTRDETTRQAAYQQGEFLLSRQTSEGWWSSVGPEREELGVQLDYTGEFTAFLAEMGAVLGAADQ